MDEIFELCIRVAPDAMDVLANFPFQEGQFLEDGYEDNEDDEGGIWLIVNLGGFSDTSPDQEQYLNTRDDVIEYTIR